MLALQEEEEQLQTVISTLGQRINPSADSETKTSSALPIHVSSQISTNSAYDNMHPVSAVATAKNLFLSLHKSRLRE